MTIRLHLTKSLYRRPAVCTVPAVRYFSPMAMLPLPKLAWNVISCLLLSAWYFKACALVASTFGMNYHTIEVCVLAASVKIESDKH